MKTVNAIVLVLLFIVSSYVWSGPSPVSGLEQSANQIIAELKQNKGQLKQNPGIVHKIVQRHFVSHVDVEGMSRSVLGRQAWNKATASEKKQFENAFTNLVIRTYSNPLTEYTDEQVRFLPVRESGNNRFLRIKSEIIRSKGPNIPLSYSLVLKNGNWKIYDMSVEGVSLLQSFRSQFAQVLQNANMQDLIKQMEQKQLKKAA